MRVREGKISKEEIARVKDAILRLKLDDAEKLVKYLENLLENLKESIKKTIFRNSSLECKYLGKISILYFSDEMRTVYSTVFCEVYHFECVHSGNNEKSCEMENCPKQ